MLLSACTVAGPAAAAMRVRTDRPQQKPFPPGGRPTPGLRGASSGSACSVRCNVARTNDKWQGQIQAETRDATSDQLHSASSSICLPVEVQDLVNEGKLPQDVVSRLLELYSNPLLSSFLSVKSIRERLLADRSFPVKVGIEVGVGILTKSSAELSKRGSHFFAEIDFVLANIVMALISDYMLVFLPAPTLSLEEAAGKAASSGGMQLPGSQLFAGCPDNAFQKVRPGMQGFTVAQRAGAVLRNGAKLLVVGFGASLLGVGLTNALIELRHFIDATWSSPNAPQNVLLMSGAYASYMAVSSNLRYQIIAGVIEERGVEVVFASNPRLCNIISFIVRTSNTFIGSLLWIDYLRLLGLQPTH